MTLATRARPPPRAPRFQSFRFSVPNVRTAPIVARTIVADLLILMGHQVLVDDAQLLVSEIVTNAHVHTATQVVHIDVDVRCDRIRVAVWDDEPGSFHYPRGEHDGHGDHYEDEHGRGLCLVMNFAARWGVCWPGDSESGNKHVWFELENHDGKGRRPHA